MVPKAAVAAPAVDPRVAAYCAAGGPEVFTGVVHGNQIWAADPFDVETIHADARETFSRLVARASSPEPPATGKTLLLLGEAGSGKTHLMRAFRTAAHTAGTGYCGYLQMTARTDNYARYVLGYLIDSLDQPYKPGSSQTGLQRLAAGLLEVLDVALDEDKARLTDDTTIDTNDLAQLVHRLAYLAVQYPQFKGIHADVLRAVLYLLAPDARVHGLAMRWLRCEELDRFDREILGDLVPRHHPEMSLKTICDLGRLIYAVHTAALVLLVDQIEEVIELDRPGEERGETFRLAVNTLVDVADGLPNGVIVIGCLEDLFKNGRNVLPKPKLDRLEHDPGPIRLAGTRTADEVAALVGRRLEVLFDAFDIEPDPVNPTAPYTPASLAPLARLRSRDVLANLREHREQCRRSGWVEPEWSLKGRQNPGESHVQWEQLWNDYHAAYKSPVFDNEPALAELLGFAIRTVSAEMRNGVHFGADPDGRFVPVEVHGAGNTVEKLFVAVCDKTARGGGLGKQVEDVAKRAGEIPVVLVRSTGFPPSPTALVSMEIAKLVAPHGKGRKVVVSNADWRAMAAFREFHGKHHKAPGFAEWQRSERPLAELRAVCAILALDKLLAAAPAKPAAPTAPPPPPAGLPKELPPPPAAETATPAVKPADAPVRLGHTRGQLPTPVELAPNDLRRHAAFLGGSGSGKTTAALAVIEQLLVQGVPVVLLDRKGDLARYADPGAWTNPEPDPNRAARRDRLRAAIDVALYTPGKEAGRPLALPVVPPDLGQLPAADREDIAGFAAAALGTMMGYKGKALDPKLVILQKAIEVLSRAPGGAVTVKAVYQLVADMDVALTAEVEGYDAKHYRKLAEELLTLSVQRRRLFESGDPLDVDALLGRGPHAVPGKTRLAVVNTQGLGDAGTTEFWVSQFLLAVDRWRAKNPSDRLQAVFFLDEADQYLPAVGKPATKGPMERLLKQARSAGVGLFLATQSPGDFDYKCRDQVLTWFIGKIKEPVAISKLRPMLEDKPGAADKLADQSAGQFYLVRESDVCPVAVDRNLIPTEQLPEERIVTLARAGK